MPDQELRPHVAFLAAAAVLLVMPVLALLGLAIFVLVAGYFNPLDQVLEGTPAWLIVAFVIVWVGFVAALILTLVSRLNRRIG